MNSKFGRVLILLIVLAAGVSALLTQRKSDAELSTLQRVADDTNKGLPATLSPGIRTEKTTVGPGLKWNFSYTLLDMENSPKTVSLVADQIFSPFKARFCTGPQFSVFLEKGIVVELRVLDRTGHLVGTQQFTKQVCEAAT